MEIKIDRGEEDALRAQLAARTDADALRMRRYLAMPDLSRTPGSPIREMAEHVLARPEFKTFDIVQAPEIVPADISFDLFDFPADHPARSKSDTYYVDEQNILRTHTTVMWYYYLQNKEIRERMARGEAVGCFSFGKVYRKDEIDRNHMNVFHQLDGWYLARKEKESIGVEELQKVLLSIGRAVFGESVISRFNPETFPYTDPSLEMEVDKNGKWVEVLGSGVVKGGVLEKFGVDSSTWNGWAFGFGLERLAIISMELPDIRLLWSTDERVRKQLTLGRAYKEVSKYPPVIRDISFIVQKGFVPNDYFDLVRDVAGDLVEEVALIDTYENDGELGAGKVSYAYRITYRSLGRTLTSGEVGTLHKSLEDATAKNFLATIR